MEASPFVSIIVPSYNRAALLEDTLESLLGQDYAPDRYEVIAVNDGSTDSTRDMLAKFEARRDTARVICVHRKQSGANAARNEGVRVARGELIVLIDDDIEAPSGWLRAMVNGTLRHPGVDCFGGRIQLRLEGKPPRHCGREPLGETELEHGDEDISVQAVWSANMAVRASAFETIGLFNEALRNAEEQEWEDRLLAKGGRIIYLPEAWLWHRRTQEDLRFFNLVRARFRRGRDQVAYVRAIGQEYKVSTQLLAICRSLAHALFRGCAVGLLNASKQAGRVWGIVSQRPTGEASMATPRLQSDGHE